MAAQYEQPEERRLERLRPWQMILLSSALITLLNAFGTFFDLLTGVGMFFVYITSYFYALIVLVPILKIERFGVGSAVHLLPWFILGIPIEYFMEYAINPVLLSPWAAVGWGIAGVLVGLSADLAFYFLPASLTKQRRSVLTALIMALAYFFLVLGALNFFYKPIEGIVSQPKFLSIAFWALPWMLISSAWGGYTAYHLSGTQK